MSKPKFTILQVLLFVMILGVVIAALAKYFS